MGVGSNTLYAADNPNYYLDSGDRNMNEVKRCKCGGGIEIESRKVYCFHRTTVICTKCHRGITFEARDLKDAILKTIAMWNEAMGGEENV